MARWHRSVLHAVIIVALVPTAFGAVPERERNALLAIYNATNGAQWTDHTGWNGAAGTECQWYGVACSDNQDTVIGLSLGFNGLKGIIPNSIGDLTNLVELWMWENELSGPIPDSISSLSKLTVLDLSTNKLSGPIPSRLGSLSNLVELTLGSNPFGGTIPPELGNLASLQRLGLWDTQISGTIPSSFGQLRNLQVLDMNYNSLSGPIPQDIGNLQQLQNLTLYSNKLTGSIPASLYTISSLQSLRLDSNQLTGGLSPDISRLQNLQELVLSDNQLSGAIPAQITSLASLTDLNLYGNDFTGEIPSDIDRLQNLVYLDVGDNQLTGSIPFAISRMTKLQGLTGYQNSLTGSLPPLDALTSLEILDFNSNQLSGALPDLRALTKLRAIGFSSNRFTGTIPDMFSAMSQLETVILDYNLLTGTIPPSLSASPTVSNLYLGGNQLSGQLPSDIGKMKSLAYLDLAYNQFSGPLPESFWDLTNLVDVRMQAMALSGPLSAKIANMTKLYVLLIGDNELTGPIPPQIGSLQDLEYLQLGANHFTGPIPREIGQLKKLIQIDLAQNALSGAIPAELANLTALEDGQSSFEYNRLFTNDATLRAFINRKQYGNDFEQSQTSAPQNVKITATTDRNATVEWTPIVYQWDEGGYQVAASLTPGGTPVAITTTSSKELASAVLRGLQFSTTYYISVATVTYPHDTQRNLLVSDATAAVQATTSAPVLAPAEVVITAEPRGLVQIDGVAQNEDSFAVTNFGDIATNLTLYKDGDFFTYSPSTFSLAAGATQTITIQSIKQPVGSYWGWIGLTGIGAADDLGVSVSLLSATRPAGTVIADPATARVEITGLAGSNSVGTATFRNSGTAELRGIAVADVPWIVPRTDPITIYPGSSGSVTFTVDRSRRPEANGSLTGTLSLIYVAGDSPSGLTALGTTPSPGINVSTVTVVDSAKPQVAPGTIPALAAKEVAYFVPAVTSLTQTFGSMVSDLAILNSFGSKPVSDLRLYFTPSTASAQTALANVAALAGNQSVNLANVVTNIYGSSEPVGSLQVRTTDWQKLVVAAKLLSLNASGTYAGDVPVFRSDRSAAAGAQTFLTGLRQSNGLRSTIYLQETSGAAANARVEILDAAGISLGTRDVAVGAFGLASISDLVTDRTATAIVTTVTGSAGRISSYARIVDGASGESWSVVDWSRYYDYNQAETARVPLVGSSSGTSTTPGRRRAVRPGSGKGGSSIEGEAVTARTSTQLSVFNPTTSEARAKLKYVTTARTYETDITLAARQTVSITDAASYAGAPSASGDASLLLDPTRGRIVASGRITSGSAGTSVPVVSAQSGLRVGQSQIFSGLEDSTSTTVAKAKPGTYRTTYGFVETGNAPATVRVTVLLSDGRSLVSTVATRQFELAAGQLVVVSDMVKSIIGADRETRYPDLHNLQLEVDVTAGSGAVVPFVTLTDNATGDSLMRLE